MIDIENARALVEALKDYAEHPSSFTDISPTEADAAADTIADLLAERERLTADNAHLENVASGLHKIKAALIDERDITIKLLIDPASDITPDTAAHFTDVHDRIRELRLHHDAMKVANASLLAEVERVRRRAVAAEDRVGGLLIQIQQRTDAIAKLTSERDALARDAARFDWFFGREDKPVDFLNTYMIGVREYWEPDQWRAAIDAAMKGASDD